MLWEEKIIKIARPRMRMDDVPYCRVIMKLHSFWLFAVSFNLFTYDIAKPNEAWSMKYKVKSLSKRNLHRHNNNTSSAFLLYENSKKKLWLRIGYIVCRTCEFLGPLKKFRRAWHHWLKIKYYITAYNFFFLRSGPTVDIFYALPMMQPAAFCTESGASQGV